MSNWIQIKKEDIDIDVKENEITFYVNSDDLGNNYVILKIDELKKIIEEYESRKTL